MEIINNKTGLREKYYHRFNFNEANFESEKELFLNHIEQIKNKNCNLSFLRNIPPCIISQDEVLPYIVLDKLKISTKDYVIDTNLFFGNEYKPINSKFKDSNFISNNCKSCKYFQNHSCRGLVNQKFLKHKEQIVKKRGINHYKAIEYEYYEGHIGFSSECNNNCNFCAIKDKGIIRFLEYITPALSINEIMHFTHYLGVSGANCNALRHKCVHGEPLFHKDILTILDITRHFTLGYFMVNTNGALLNDAVLNKLSKFESPKIYLSLNSTNKRIRNKIMGFESEIEPLDLIAKIKGYSNLDLFVLIVALKENIENGDLKNTILDLKRLGIKPKIWDNLFVESEELNKLLNYDFDYINDYLIKNNLKNFVNLEKEENEGFLNGLQYIVDYINNIQNKTLVLSPKESGEFMRPKISQNLNITLKSISNTLGFKGTIAESIRIKDFLNAIIQAKNSNIEFNEILIPWRSFDAYMNDKENKNINELVESEACRNKTIWLI